MVSRVITTLSFANEKIELLKDNFTGLVISGNGGIRWPLTSCDFILFLGLLL